MRKTLGLLLAASLAAASINLYAADAQAKDTSKDKTNAKHPVVTIGDAAIITQKQLEKLFGFAMKKIKPNVKAGKVVKPGAAMMLQNGDIKGVKIDAGNVPAMDQIKIYRAVLRAVARHNQVTATLIYYTAQPRKGSDEKILLMEYEHRLGVSGTRAIPYELKDKKVTYGVPQDLKKPFVEFYDQNRVPKKGEVKGSQFTWKKPGAEGSNAQKSGQGAADQNKAQ